MLILLSPAKIQNFEPQKITTEYTVPQFIDEAEQLVQALNELSAIQLSKLLNISANLAQQNADRYYNWQLPFTPENSKQAILAFDGEVFRSLQANTFSAKKLRYAQQHIRILSGLYGVLRPLDLIQPYRLEVSTRLKNPSGKDLYAFWQQKVTHAILEALEATKTPPLLINLASSEYFKTVNLKKSTIEVIDVEFYEYKNDELKQIVMYTKKARGMMAKYIIENEIDDLEELKGFNAEGYWYYPQLSTARKLFFVRQNHQRKGVK